jgi:hypothetical protein
MNSKTAKQQFLNQNVWKSNKSPIQEMGKKLSSNTCVIQKKKKKTSMHLKNKNCNMAGSLPGGLILGLLFDLLAKVHPTKTHFLK